MIYVSIKEILQSWWRTYPPGGIALDVLCCGLPDEVVCEFRVRTGVVWKVLPVADIPPVSWETGSRTEALQGI